MPQEYDFDRAWLDKFCNCLDEAAGEKVRTEVMAGSERLSEDSSRNEVIAWTQEAMEQLESLLDNSKCRAVMTGCACQYPKSDLQEVREAYESSGDIDLAHRMLQEKFEEFLRNVIHLSDEHFEAVFSRGWGLAGIKEGNTITATKIPKSGLLSQYLDESDSQEKREYYCHCPRVRDAVGHGETLPLIHCYCGAGFYKGIWEEILQEPVEVEMLESVLQGGEICTIAVHLPASV
ncbi:hypothetical protein ACFLV7_16150 [Chloroflexota bacterium]